MYHALAAVLVAKKIRHRHGVHLLLWWPGLLKRPAKAIPHRMEDMRMTGKRNPYSSDYKIGLDEALKNCCL